MQLIPAIDIKDGRCVRLLRGAFDQQTVFADDPDEPAQRFRRLGANRLHVVDLDGALCGRPVNYRAIGSLARTFELQAGGGLRTPGDVATVLAAGIKRVVLGTLVVTNPLLVSQLIREFGSEAVVLALDVRRRQDRYFLAVEGWTRDSDADLVEVLARFEGAGVSRVLVTDISRDGALSGPNLRLYRTLSRQFPALRIQASGGIRKVTDLVALADTGVSAAISGRALLEGRMREQELKPFLRSA